MTANMRNKRNAIRSIEDLHAEKELIRNEIAEHEQVLKSHYQSILHKVNPILYIADLFSGKSKEGENETNKNTMSWMETILKTFVSAAAGDILYKRSKKNFGKALMAYALEQGKKIITEKDIAEHIEKIKEWLKKKENTNEETEDED
ncbi:MAG: hypothetical protein ACKVPJ_05815 [Chitinophagales bacterium]